MSGMPPSYDGVPRVEVLLGPSNVTMARRSTRVRARISLWITGLDPARPLRISSETLIVNAHGCVARLSQALELGTPVRIQVRDNVATARVVGCQRLREEPSEWLAGLELDTPGNIWGLNPCPEDWTPFEADAAPLQAPAGQKAATPAPSQLKMPVWPLASPSPKSGLLPGLANEELRKQLAALQEAIASLQDRLAHSLTSMPELVQRQVEAESNQLRIWLAEQQTRSAENASQRLEQLTKEVASQAARVLEEKLKADVRTQAQQVEADLSKGIGAMLTQASELRQQILSLLSTLQQERERCETQVRTLLEQKQEVQVWITERTGSFQKTLQDALAETSGQIKGRLQMAMEASGEPIERLRDEAMQQLQEQAGRQERQLRENFDEASERLASFQRQIESATRESLRAQGAETSTTFGREITQVAQRFLEEWHSALAKNLESLTNSLGQKLPGGDK